MWMQGGVDEADRLDAEAAKHVIRRAARRCCGPTGGRSSSPSAMVIVWTAHDARRAVPRPLRHRPRHRRRTTPARSTPRSSATWSSPCISYVAYRFQVQLISRIGESFLRDLRLRVFDHLQRLSMPFYDREKAGVIVSRMTSDVDSLQELVQMGLLMFVSNGILLVVSVVVLGAGVVEAPAALPDLRAVRRAGEHQVPARLEQGVPRRARRHRQHALAAPGGHRRRPGRPGLRSRGRRGRALRAGQPAAVRRPHALGEDLGLVPAGDRVRGPVHHRHRRRGRRLLGVHGRADRRHRHVLRAHALEPVRADPAALAALQHRAVGRRRR